ncbi:histidine kinase dimerization/phospho-acceptor domain-containing protein, partial [Arthrospira platensis SPKY1]|nr:histidine kinase dimerization/phospho-acceptor domain-containing protein [Arthrospira platensis SPKY1]
AQHELQDQVRAATTELRGALQKLERQNAELERAHQAALQANEAQSRFLSSMSHEIRTPLHGAIASADLLLRTRPLSRRQLDHATTIQHSARWLLNLVNNLLDWSKIEATGDLPLGEADFNLP